MRRAAGRTQVDPTAAYIPRRQPAILDVTRYVQQSVQFMLWGKAAGRCEFAGCNEPLWKSPVTQEQVNTAQKAHIYSFSSMGPRGNKSIAPDQLNDLPNLMLVCHRCHRKLDREPGGGRYTVDILRQMKSRHEERVERVTAIETDKTSHVLLYGANVGDHSSPLNYREAAPALFPDRYPASDRPTVLSMLNSSFSDRDNGFWPIEAENLYRKFNQQVRERIAAGDIRHLSVFSLAPQPLLILLGSLLGDIVPADIYQRHREPPTWQWPPPASTPEFEVTPGQGSSGPPALVLAMSGTVASERVTAVLGSDANIWTVSVVAPHNDLTKSRAQLSQFRAVIRSVLDRIKIAHGQATTLHIFPAASVSLAVEFGRVRMPKADMPWLIYDQVNAGGGFIAALTVPYGETR
jgi:hypothetical protein